jgi:hypothetical protein
MSVQIDGYPLDCALEERLTYESEVTEFPVEKGADIADHIRAKRPVLEIDGVVSDTPIGKVANDPSRTNLSGAMLPSRDAFDRLVQLHGDRRTITVECSFGKFDDMVLMSLTPTRDVKTHKAFKFTATFRQIEFRQNNRTTIRVAVPNASGKINFGALLGAVKGTGVTFVTSHTIANRAGLLRQGFKLVSTTTHKQRLASSLKSTPAAGTVNPETLQSQPAQGFDPFAAFGEPGKVDHYFADETEVSDGYVTGPNKQDYYPYVSHVTSTSVAGKRVHWNYATQSWVDDDSNKIVEHPPKGDDRWKNITFARAPGTGQ